MAEVDLTPISIDSIPGAREIMNEYAVYQILDYEGLIKELNASGIELSEDPSVVPLNKLNAKIAQVDAQKTRVATILTQAIVNENGLDVLVKKINSLYKAEFDRRLPQDPVNWELCHVKKPIFCDPWHIF